MNLQEPTCPRKNEAEIPDTSGKSQSPLFRHALALSRQLAAEYRRDGNIGSCENPHCENGIVETADLTTGEPTEVECQICKRLEQEVA